MSAKRDAMSNRPSLGPATAILGFTVILSCGAMVPRVDAGIGGSSTIVMPETVVVGVTFTATMTIRNQLTPPNDTESVRVTGVFITPSCADSFSSICFPPNLDPGVFDILSAGDSSTAPCAGIGFQIGTPNPATGEVQLFPNQTITLGPSVGPVAAGTCQVDLLMVAEKLPENPVQPSTGQTFTLGHTALQGVTSGLNGTTASTSLYAADPVDSRPDALRVGDDHAGGRPGPNGHDRAAQANGIAHHVLDRHALLP